MIKKKITKLVEWWSNELFWAGLPTSRDLYEVSLRFKFNKLQNKIKKIVKENTYIKKIVNIFLNIPTRKKHNLFVGISLFYKIVKAFTFFLLPVSLVLYVLYFVDTPFTFVKPTITVLNIKNSFDTSVVWIRESFSYLYVSIDSFLYFVKLYTNVHIFIFLFFYFCVIVQLTLFSYKFGINGIYKLSVIAVCTLWIFELNYFFQFMYSKSTILLNLTFFGSSTFPIIFNFCFILNFLTYSFLFLTTSIAVCASFYTLVYFKNEPSADRFVLLIHWFVLSMSTLVLSCNAILLYLGWELIGFTSFLLINFWYLRRGTLKAAFKAFTFNKFSDVCILFFVLGMGLYSGSFDTENWLTQFTLYSTQHQKIVLCLLFLLFFAASVKSAQLIGHLWLPDSMEAPIPASALIHSATLVSAGVYLLLKFQFLFVQYNLSYLLLFFGLLTSLYGAVVSAAQTDLKKLLAYSTISHCGFLVFTIGLHNTKITIIYLYLHGFFKALTFFCVGNLLKSSKGYQDSRKMGAFFQLVPIESVLFVTCSANLAALPFTIGYYYKHFLQILLQTTNWHHLFAAFALLSMLCSVIYFFRLVYYALFDIKKNNEVVYNLIFLNNYKTNFFSLTPVLGYVSIFLILFFVYLFVFYFFIDLTPSYIYSFTKGLNVVETNFFFNIHFYNLEYNTGLQPHFLEFSILYNIFFTSISLILLFVINRYSLNFFIFKLNTTLFFVISIICIFFFV